MAGIPIIHHMKTTDVDVKNAGFAFQSRAYIPPNPYIGMQPFDLKPHKLPDSFFQHVMSDIEEIQIAVMLFNIQREDRAPS